ncbi:histone-fold-containing protein [Myriangium duriaei CBS 260.36]|uniref:Histone H4 n=1 Tax=Myriangium duriaei CBS 260.36 TaxID=1168546 RepID=A0A9P4IUN4_9PEZI|nr:histone-fold-containing protein [Myriangium duriaei CBS 260.36]
MANAATPPYGGLGLGKSTAQRVPLRHRKLLRDNILGVTKPALRRLARRGGVKRMSSEIYDTIRLALKQYLERVLKDVAAISEYTNRKTVRVEDIIFVLNKQGRPLYGFGPVDDGGKMPWSS